MSIDFHFFVDLLTRWPVLWVLAGGAVFGMGLSQLIKQTWLQFGSTTVSAQRYRVSVRWLAALTTYGFTMGLWHSTLSHTGIEEWVCAGWGLFQPVLYDALRALVAVRWPDFAAKWGSNASLN